MIHADTPLKASPPGKITFEEFIRLVDEDDHAEWVDGEVIFMSPASDWHQDLVTFLGSILRTYVEERRLGRLFVAPFLMKTGVNLPAREPDIVFLKNENLYRNKRTYVEGPADLVVEIVSPDSRTRDRVEKFREYEQGGVQEYWVLDPLRETAEFYVLEEGAYHSMPIEDGVFRSSVLEGLWLRVDWLWQEPLPFLNAVQREWGLI